MEGEAVFSVLGLAFGLGLLHALDADHILAVTTLACTRPRRRAALAFCGRWALGHGLTLFAIGGAVLLLGLAVPRELSHWAERLVGVVLLMVGAWVLVDLVRQRLRLGVHRHAGMPAHAHWRTPSASRGHGHGAVLVGVVHGAAGSAPLLAVLPVAATGAPLLGLAYLLVFGLAVLAMMLVCGGLLGQVWGRLPANGRWLAGIRALVATGALAFGAHWLAGA
ncbi:MAG TPA: sulfite exporter TauE/SafE family protein [Gammaproteobacteria bacterium]|nr:sulfite exporter TauE/SafE family protein [Gammaproteobacteria bacterium]